MAVVDIKESATSLSVTDSPKDQETPVTTSPEQDAQLEGQTGTPQQDADTTQGAKTTVPDDHPTKLGRRVSRMEERMTDMFDRLDTLMVKLDTGVPTRMPNYEAPMETEEVPEHIKETVVAVKKELAKETQREEEMQRKYADGYIKAVQKGFGDVDEELHNAVVKELLETNFRNYKKATGDPTADAQINYDRAVAAILRRQRASSKIAPNVRGDKPNAPTEVSSALHLDGPPERKIELDEYSRKFLKAIGAKEDDPWVLESLKGVK